MDINRLNKIFRKLLFLILVGFTLSTLCICFDMEYSPFATDVDEKNLTIKNLDEIKAHNDGQVPFKIAFFSDTHQFYDETNELIKILNKRTDIDFVIIAGDITYMGLLKEYEWAVILFKKLNTPFLTVIGNHDALSHGKHIYKEMFGDYNYHFIYKGIQFVMFNDNNWEFGGNVPDSAWLEGAASYGLYANYSVLICHIHPGSGAGGRFDATTLDRFNNTIGEYFSLAIHGHGHFDTEHYLINDVPRYVIGSTGYGFYMIVTFYEDSFEVESCRF